MEITKNNLGDTFRTFQNTIFRMIDGKKYSTKGKYLV